MYTLRNILFFIVLGFYCKELNAQFINEIGPQLLHVKKENYKIDPNNTKRKDLPFVFKDVMGNTLHATWTQFDKYKSKDKRHLSVIYYAASNDSGKTWTQPKQLNKFAGNCSDGDSTVKGPRLCKGPKGEIYATWAGPKGLAFQRSLDTGKTWLPEEKIVAALKGGWTCKVNGITTDGLAQLVCDTGSSEFKGRIYVCWSDEKNGEKNKDVFLVYSDDKGETWTDPILLSYHPNHKEQFSPRMLLEPTTGKLFVLYFDKQNDFSGKYCDLYLAVSGNGGLKFDYFRLNEIPFQFNANFHELILEDKKMYPIWLQVSGEKRFGYFTVNFNDSNIMAYNEREMKAEMLIERSFSFAERIQIDFTLHNNTELTAVITKPLEPKFEKIVVEKKRCFAGKNNITVDTKNLKLPKDNYVLSLYYSGRNTFVWIVAE